MKLYEKAQEAAQAILTVFKNPNELPKPLAMIFVHRKDRVPCRNWSWRNQLIVALRGYVDARGFRQWQAVERQVKKGEKAFYILSPCAKKVIDDKTGKERTAIFGFRGTPVFGLEQTEGEPLASQPQPEDEWLDTLPLIDVARRWGISVEAFNGGKGPLGEYYEGRKIGLGVKSLAVWAHELVHAADHRNGKLTVFVQHWRSETVAQLGGAVLLRILGYEHEADLGGCWEYIQHYATKSNIDVVDACGLVLDRTCEAVALILDEAERSRSRPDLNLALAVG
jgi:hypothetical protein